jgi:uncharacterized membrane protein
MNMKQERLENLADGIFAIVMTLLVLELRVPVLTEFTNVILAREFVQFIPYLMSYITSFAVLYTFWHSHHFIASIYAKNITVDVSTINAVFLFFIGLIPFTAHLLATYHTEQFAIFIFSIHIIVIGLVLFYMRHFIKHSLEIENNLSTRSEENHSKARILFPVFCALLAMGVSFFSPTGSLAILTLGILFNFSRKSTKIIFSILRVFNSHLE